MTKHKPTMKDVAQMAGVTQPTVSYVINGTANVTDEVREKVLHAIDELGYKPNVYARFLRTRHSNLVGIIIPDITNQYFSSVVNHLERMLYQHQRNTIISSTSYDPAIEEQALNYLLSYEVDTLIVTYELSNPVCWKIIQNAHCRVILLECGSVCPNHFHINIDSHSGGYMATQHLLQQGRKRIAYIDQNVTSETHSTRLQGYLDAMRNYGHSDECKVFRTPHSSGLWMAGLTIGKTLVSAGFDGIVTASDILAVGIVKQFLAAGIRIPEDIAITGYDDIPLAEIFVPALTTVRQPMETMCRWAVDAIISDNDTSGRFLEIKPELIIRDTA